jgi:NAD(P)-dependent dehydrogenase (short-subunit alcohol dehydrogenase family)
LSRNPTRLVPIVSELGREGIEAAAFGAHMLHRASIGSGLAAVKQRFGRIDVLEVSPADQNLPLVSATELTLDNVQHWIDFQVHGVVAAVRHVLPSMLARGAGTILLTTGASSVHPHLGATMFANATLAMGALRNWALALHEAVAPRGVQVGHVAIGALIGQQKGATPEAIAPLYWELHTNRDLIEKVLMPQPPRSDIEMFRDDYVAFHLNPCAPNA